MVIQICTSNSRLNTGAAASQPQASKKPLRRLVGGEQYEQDKSMFISAPVKKAPVAPAAPQVTPATSLFTDLFPSSFPHHTAVPPSPTIVFHNQRLSQAITITEPPEDRPKAQAMCSAQPIQRPSAHLANTEAVSVVQVQHLTASGGQSIRLSPREGQWHAQVTERIGHAQRQMVLPVVCAPGCQVAALLRYKTGQIAQLLHVTKQGMNKFVYVGRQGLLGGMMPQGSMLKLRPWKHQGSTPLEQAQSRIESLQEAIEEGHGLLLSIGTADLQVIEKLFSDLAQWLKEEQLYRPAAGNEGAKEYIIRLREDARLLWEDHRAKLTKLLGQAYGQALQQVVAADLIDSLPDRVMQLSAALNQLAGFHHEQGKQTGELSHYTDAAILYQHVRMLCEKDASGYEAQITGAYQSLAQIKTAMLAKVKQAHRQVPSSTAFSAVALRKEIEIDRGELAILRQEARDGLAMLAIAEMSDEAPYSKESKALFRHIAKQVGALLARLYQESEHELGPAPCKYMVMGLGSMALQQMTPYSDLEFAILIEGNEDAATLDKHRAYFRELSHLVHLRVINLGETVVPRSKYGVSLDYLSKRGINFDLGGKTPLGRKDKPYFKKPYELIQPVAGMMYYLKNVDQKMEHMDKLLPFILERTCYVHGDPELHAAYEQASKKFLQESQSEEGVPVYQARALQKLLKGVVEMDYSYEGPGLSKASQQGDLADFAPQIHSLDAGRLYDVKQEIYRLPDRLLCRLAMYYGLLPESGWDAVDQLHAKGIISEAAAGHLGYAVSFATLLRLRTYLHHGQQKEEMAVLRGTRQGPTQEAVSQSFVLDAAGLEKGGSLFKYYYTALPLHKRMKEFFNTKEKGDNFFQSEPFYDDNDKVKGMICMRLMQYESGIKCYEQAIEWHKECYGAQDHPDLAAFLDNVGIAYHALGEAKQALNYFEQAIAMHKAMYGKQNHPTIAGSLNNVGLAYDALGDETQALQYQVQALVMKKALYGDKAHPNLADSLGNIGSAYHKLGDAKQGLAYLEQALVMKQKLYEAQAHPSLAMSLMNVGNAYKILGDTQKGLTYYEQALDMNKVLYGVQAHPGLAMSLCNLGGAYKQLGDAHKGIECYEQALEMNKALYGDKAHPNLAGSLDNLGIAYENLGEVRKGLAYKKRALEMNKVLYEDKAHPLLAGSLDNMGIAYAMLGDLKQALTYFEQALEMYRALYGVQDHPDLAGSLNNVGQAYEMLGEMCNGLQYKVQALEMYKMVYENKPHPALAASLCNVGLAHKALGDVKQALAYFEQALEMYKAIYGDEPHPDIARSLGNLGIAYAKLGDVCKGLVYFKQALEIRQALYGEQVHPDLAMSLDNIGTAYAELGDLKQALAYFEQALEMYKAIYGDRTHPDLVRSLDKVDLAHTALEFQRFLDESV